MEFVELGNGGFESERAARVPRQQDQFLINPYGLLFDEVTASSLVKIDGEGNKVEPSETEVNSGGFAIPRTVHMARGQKSLACFTPTRLPAAPCRCNGTGCCPSTSMPCK